MSENKRNRSEEDERTCIGMHDRPVFIRLREADVELFPDIEFMIEGVLPTVGVTLVYGITGGGKTLNAIHFAQCVGRGIPWFGRKVKQGKVLYIYAEGKLGLKPRLQAWRKHHDVGMTDSVTYIVVPVQLIGDKQKLMDTIEDMIAAGERPELIIIDTFSNCTESVDQVKQDEVYAALAVCHEIKDKYSVQVIAVHHNNRSGGFNGSQAFLNHVDTAIEVMPDENVLVMRCHKQRDGTEKFKDIKLYLQQIDLGINPKTQQQLSSCVVTSGDTLYVQAAKVTKADTEQAIMLKVLALHGTLSTNKWKEYTQSFNVPVRAFDRHLSVLVATEKVTRERGGNGRATNWSLTRMVDLESVLKHCLEETDKQNGHHPMLTTFTT